jgi:hypothetical protein
MPRRKVCFCASVPAAIKVGPTVLRVTKGTGAPARRASSNQIICSIAVRP